MTGLFKPLLILPDEHIEPERLRLMLLHEVIHIKRGDIWVRVLTLIATAAHWFNPLVYLMNRAIRTEAELACDTAVLRHAGNDARFDYGETILNTARKSLKLSSALAHAMSGEGKNLKRRLANIIERKHTRRWLAVICASLMIGGVMLAGLLSVERGTEEDLPDDDGDNIAVDIENKPPIDEIFDEEPTEQLVLYFLADRWFNSRFDAAITVFKRQYPEVDVVIERIGERDDGLGEAYLQRVRSELMAGMGPDIVLTHYFNDIHKTMDNGMFLDLNGLWNGDSDFEHKEQLHPVVMDAGIYKGKRYIIPLSYEIPIVMGERGMLDSVGFRVEDITDLASFFNMVSSVLPAARENALFDAPFSLWRFSELIYIPFGIPIVDFSNGAVLPDETAFKAFAEAYKPFWRYSFSWPDFENSTAEKYLSDRRVIFFNSYTTAPFQEYLTFSNLLRDGYEPVLIAIPDHNGGIHASVTQSVAIRAGSPNQQNAWNFIKILLSENIQYGRVGTPDAVAFWGVVVNRGTVERQLYELLLNTVNRGSTNEFLAIPQEAKDPMRGFHNNITRATLPNKTIDGFFADMMEPYFKGEITLDNAIENLRRRLRLYISE
jgi:ABC-type glycerol-3-phosphate transport system substrate-binding protein